MAAFLLLLVIAQNSMGVASQTVPMWQCGNSHCLCSSTSIQQTTNDNLATKYSYHNNSNNNNSSSDNKNNILTINKTTAICHLKTIIDYKSLYPSLPLNMKSLTISCMSQNTTQRLYENMFARHNDLREITLKMCSVKHIHPHFASGTDKLTNLHFSECVLPLFAQDTFSSMESLICLRMTSSIMVNFPHFDELKNLQILDLSHNKVKYPDIAVNSNVQNLLIDLVNVSLSYNGIKNIPPTFFGIIPNLKYLDLDGNDLSHLSIPPDAAQHIQQFTAVDNNLDFIDVKHVLSSRNLTQFRTTGSGQQSLIFDGSLTFPNLIDLKLSGFRLNDSIWNILGMASIRKLDVSSNNVETVDLIKFPYLQRIYLQENKLSEISSDTFRQQQNLLVVNISFNNISHLPENLFSSSPNLLGFLVKGNKITSLSSQFFTSSPNLFYLDLSHNKIERLPYGLFMKIPNLLYIYIQGNRLTSLPSFTNLKSLHHLDISHNRLRFLSSISFQGLESLQFLIANDNHFTMIPIGLFTPCKILLDVNFDNNQIEFIGSLENHPRITRLRFDNNSLTDFTNISPFAYMQSLESIFLDQNYFQTIYPNMFPPSIEIISMVQNDIIRLLLKSLNNTPRLSVVNLMLSRYVISIPQGSVQIYGPDSIKPSILLDFTDLSCSCWLGYLKVWDERRYDMPELVKRFPNFKGLENAHCVTPRYPDALFKFKDVPLRDFVCEYSESLCYDIVCNCCRSPNDNSTCACVYTCPVECQCFEGGSSFWKNYVHIVCRKRNLTHVPDLIPALANFIHLDGNVLSSLKKFDFLHLTHVEELYLNNSRITSIADGIFDGMGKIEKINLGNNLMTSVNSNTFGSIASLISLDLSYNEINQIQVGSFDGLINLKTLYLNNNRLRYLSNNFLEIPNLHSLTLAFNHWSCNCAVIENLSSFVSRRGNADIIKDRSLICCQFDSSHSQQTFFHSLQNLTAPLYQDTFPVSDDKTLGSPPEKMANYTNGSNDRKHLSSQKSVQFQNFNIPHFDETDDLANVSCFPLIKFNFEQACEAVTNMSLIASKTPSSQSAEIRPEISIGLVTTATILVLLIFFIVLFTLRRGELLAVVYAKTGVRILDKKAKIDKKEKGTKPFDAFISYSQKDHDFVCNTLVPDLEKTGYQVCVHYRDFPVGGDISDVINRAIHLSSRTILVVSRHFLESNWCRYEFQTAHHHILKEGSHRLVLVLLEDIPEDIMDPDFRTHMKINTYLKAQDAWFWEKLHFALPDVTSRKHQDEDSDDNNFVMRGMKILSNTNVCPDDNNDGGDDDDGNQKKVEVLSGMKMIEGREKDGGMKEKVIRKIDWKKEEERILSERKYKDEMLNVDGKKEVYMIGDRQIGFDWMNNVDDMYINT